MMKPNSFTKYEEAQKQVKKIKDFYGHLFIFLIIVPLVYIARFYALPKLGIIVEEEGLANWLNWNTYIFPLLWLLVIAVHALTLYKPTSIKNWEQKKIREIMEKEEQETQQYWK